MWFAILRIVIPLLIVVLLVGFFWPRYRQYKESKRNMIEVEAEVVNSKQHDPTKEDDPHKPNASQKSHTKTKSDTE